MSAARLTSAIAVLVTVGALAYFLRPATDSPAAPQLTLSAPTGEVRIVNSKEGEAILSAPNWRPGDVAKGKVAIHNAGDSHGVFVLSAKQIEDELGSGGGKLSKVTRVRVVRMRPKIEGQETVYRGKLAKLRTVRVGDWPAGGSRYFRLRAKPKPKSGEANRYQHAELSFMFRWRARPGASGASP